MDNNIKADYALKVLVAIPCLGIGGTEMQTLSLSNVLMSFGYAVEVICYFEHEASIVREFEKNGIKVNLLNLERETGLLRIILKMRKEIQIKKSDILHVQYMAPGTLPIIAGRLAGVKKVFATVHQPWTTTHGSFSKIILRIGSLLCTKFIAVSVNAEKTWFGNGRLLNAYKPLKLQPHHFTIHNSIDTEKIIKITSGFDIDDLKMRISVPAGITVIGAVSRLKHEKGIDLLIEAFYLLLKCNIKAHLLLVGTGPDEMILKDSVKMYGINHYVTFYGEADWEKAIQLMGIMDIVVVPSRFEGFGLTAAEAMAAGKPVIASETSGLKEIVINDETGILFPVDNIQALEGAIKCLINDTKLRKRFGNAGKSRAETNFSLDLFRKKIKTLYGY